MSNLLNNITDTTTTVAIDAGIKSSMNILLTCVLLALASVSVCGNFLVFFTLYRRPYLLTPSNMLVFSLTISNFLFSIFLFPFMIVSTIKQIWSFGEVWCSLSGFLSLTTLAASMFTLLVISCDRCYAIVYPLKYSNVVTSFRIICAVTFCWLIAASISIPPLLGSWSKLQYSNAQMSCLPSWGLNLSFSCFWISFSILFPYSAMAILYSFILYVVCMKTRRVRDTELEQCSTTRINNFVCDKHQASFIKRGRNMSEFTDNADIMADISSFGHSNVVNSRIALASHGPAAKSDYSVVLPHQITDDHIPSDSSDLKSTTNEEPTNNNNVGNTLHLSNVLYPTKPSSVDDTTSVDYLTLPSPTGPSASASHRRSHFRSRAKSSSLRPSRSLAIMKETRSRVNSLNALNNITEINTLSPFARNLSRSSNALRSSARSLASNRAKVIFTLAYHDYEDQKKALCTVLSVVGVLFICCGPFVVTSLYDAVHGKPMGDTKYQSSVADWLVSATTILLLLTCVYHPLFYGLWNRTLRKEMRNVICGGARGPNTRRTRILSLTSHLKDLGLSPRVTSAIMQESATVATIVRPMRLDDRPIRKHPTCRTYVEASSPTRWKKTSVKEKRKIRMTPKEISSSFAGNEVIEKSIEPSINNDVGVSCCENAVSDTGLSKNRPANKANDLHNIQLRDREQLATGGPLAINSSQVLSSEILLPALLFNSFSNNLNFDDANATSCPHSGKAMAHSNRRTTVLNQSSSSDTERISVSGSETSTPDTSNASDTVSKLTKGKLHSSNLIHLEAGEPVQVRNWNRNQTIDYFAQTLAYDLVEGIDLEM